MLRKMAVLLLCCFSAAAPAQKPFADVPRSHWAYACVSSLARKGLTMSMVDGTFGGKRALTRYEFAVLSLRAVQQLDDYIKPVDIDGRPRAPLFPLTPEDFGCLKKMLEEFRPEIEQLKADPAKFKADLDRLAADPRLRAPALAAKNGRMFPDVPKDHWAYDAVRFVAERGLMVGYPETKGRR